MRASDIISNIRIFTLSSRIFGIFRYFCDLQIFWRFSDVICIFLDYADILGTRRYFCDLQIFDILGIFRIFRYLSKLWIFLGYSGIFGIFWYFCDLQILFEYFPAFTQSFWMFVASSDIFGIFVHFCHLQIFWVSDIFRISEYLLNPRTFLKSSGIFGIFKHFFRCYSKLHKSFRSLHICRIYKYFWDIQIFLRTWYFRYYSKIRIFSGYLGILSIFRSKDIVRILGNSWDL